MRVLSIIGATHAFICGLLVADTATERWEIIALDKIEGMAHTDDFETLNSVLSYATIQRAKPEAEHHQLRVSARAIEELRSLTDLRGRLHAYLDGLRSGWKSGNVNDSTWESRRTELMWKLRSLPLPQVVGFLGDTLDDSEPPPSFGSDFNYPENSILAQSTLMQILADPPTTDDRAYYQIRDLDRWKAWFADVEAGRQTFRFKGDPQEWTLAGPVNLGARAALPSRSRSLGSHVTESAGTGTTSDGEPFLWLPLVAATLFFAAGCAWYLSSRKSGSVRKS